MIDFRLLGPVQVVVDGEPVPLGAPKQRALLAELLLHRGEVVTRTHLVDALWDEGAPETATSALQVYVHGLRRALGSERIETQGSGYRIRVEPDELDVERFETLLDRAARALADGSPRSRGERARPGAGALARARRSPISAASRPSARARRSTSGAW